MPRAKYLVVDTSAFIRNVQLQEFGENLITLDAVIKEITNHRQLKNLVVLPYDLQVKEPFPENIKTVTDFSKKTGDFRSLSSIDLKVLALVYQLEKEFVGSEHIKTVPQFTKLVTGYENNKQELNTNLAGFYNPDENHTVSGNDINEEKADEGIEDEHEKKLEVRDVEGFDHRGSDSGASCEGEEEEVETDLAESLDKVKIEDSLKRIEILEEDELSDDDNIFDDDECGWITPGNVQEVKRGVEGGLFEEKPVMVACLTTDFAMQNVLKQMGLNVMSLDGRIIREMRTYIFRCYACFKTTSVMTHIFCPNCGLKTLKRVAVSVDEEGKEHIFINFKRPLTAKGKRFSIPRPQGGKYANNPILVADQRVPQQRLSKKALKKNNPLDPDYIAGVSPFMARDVASKSIMLGFHTNAKKHRPGPNRKKHF